MKKLVIYLFFVSILIASCQPDSKDNPEPTPTGINFVGSWNRDSVIVNDVQPNGLKTRIDFVPNHGSYNFNSDNKTGVLILSGSDFAITWKYTSSANNIMISEIDWPNQDYSIQQVSSTKLILTGEKDTGGGNSNERIMYLTRK